MQKFYSLLLIFIVLSDCVYAQGYSKEPEIRLEQLYQAIKRLPGFDSIKQSAARATICEFTDSIYHSDWDTLNQEWMLTQKHYYKYNADKLTMYYNQLDTNYNGSWDSVYKEIYTFRSPFTPGLPFDEWWNLVLSKASFDKYGNGWVGSLFSCSYDGAGNNISDLSQFIDISGNLTNSEKTTYTFNSNNQLTHALTEIWDTALNVWINYSRIDKVLNSYGYVLTEESIFWDKGTLSWRDLGRKYINTYDSNNYRINHHQQQLNKNTGVWENVGQQIFVFDNMGRQTSHTIQLWYASDTLWRNFSRQLNTYNNLGLVIDDVLQSWNVATQSWDSRERTVNSYDSKSRLTDSYKYTSNGIDTIWKPLSKLEYTYIDTNRFVESKSAYWNNVAMGWHNFLRHSYTYDEYNNDIIVIYDNWDSINALWIQDRYFTFLYSQSNRLLMSTGRYFNDEVRSAKKIYYGECLVVESGLSDMNLQSEVYVFPNPAISELNISYAGDSYNAFSICNLNGQLVKSGIASNSIDVSELMSGLYIIELIGKESIDKKRFVKQ